MANVLVETDKLRSGGEYIQTIYNDNENNFEAISNTDCGSCQSLSSFKSALASKNEAFRNRTKTISDKLIECANNLQKTDDSTGSNASKTFTELNNLASIESDTNATQLSDYSISGELDYTFDPSNVGITAEELYKRAAAIRNSNIPINIKVVKAAKLLHEYTLGWTWDRDRLAYSDFESTMEIGSKTIVCATGVSDALYLAGAVNTIGNSAGQFNPNYQKNIMITAEKNGWERIDSADFDQLQAGDIVFTGYNGYEYGHVELYAGNGYSYSWGRTEDMNHEGPKSVSISGYQSLGACAYRIKESEEA